MKERREIIHRPSLLENLVGPHHKISHYRLRKGKYSGVANYYEVSNADFNEEDRYLNNYGGFWVYNSVI